MAFEIVFFPLACLLGSNCNCWLVWRSKVLLRGHAHWRRVFLSVELLQYISLCTVTGINKCVRVFCVCWWQRKGGESLNQFCSRWRKDYCKSVVLSDLVHAWLLAMYQKFGLFFILLISSVLLSAWMFIVSFKNTVAFIMKSKYRI